MWTRAVGEVSGQARATRPNGSARGECAGGYGARVTFLLETGGGSGTGGDLANGPGIYVVISALSLVNIPARVVVSGVG